MGEAESVGQVLGHQKAVIFLCEWQDEGKLMTCRTRKSLSGECSFDWKPLCENLELHTGLDCVEQCGGRVLLHGRGATQVKGVQTVARETGLLLSSNVPISLFTDSSAAKSFVSRRGLGRMRHEATRELWLQEEVLSRRLVVKKVHGEVNPADLLTKYLGHQTNFSGVILIFSRLQAVGSSRFDRGRGRGGLECPWILQKLPLRELDGKMPYLFQR